MKKWIASLLFISFAFVSFAQTKEQKLDELLSAYNKLYAFSGTAFVAANGQTLLEKGYGYSNMESKTMNDAQSLYQIGSISKQFTTTLILKLAEMNKLKLTDKLTKYFPGYPNGDKITIHHLMSHTSGIFNYTNDVEFMSKHSHEPTTEKVVVELLKKRPLDFEPGTNWNYSNSGYMLLGYIIQKVTKKPYETVMRDFIFKPLQMTNSGFDFIHSTNAHKAIGYSAISEKTNSVAQLVDSSVSFAAGSIYTTASDLYKWHQAVLNNKILKRATIEKAFTVVKNKYGYGWMMDSINNKRITKHSGGIDGFNAYFARVEADNVCVVLLNNMGNPRLEEINKNILALLYDMPYKVPQLKTEVKVSEEILQKYVGTYELMPQFVIVVTLENGTLFGAATGQGKFELFAQKENYFFLKAVDAEVEFVSDDKGAVQNLILYQGGRKTPAKKIK
jgi:CubicO group peptidase (beta-lactamase class C family)